MDITPGVYRHYKGKDYEVLLIAHHSETEEKLVVYKALYSIPGYGDGSIWVRPYEMFAQEIIVDGIKVPRFKKCG